MNRKTLAVRPAFRVKEAEDGSPVVVGYASAFNVLDSHGDVVVPGAFAKSIVERFERGLVKMLWQHDPERPIGVPVKLEEDSYGLRFEARLANTPLANEARELMRAGVVDRFSIGYEVTKSRRSKASELGIRIPTDPEVNVLEEIKLYEFSPVTFAANEEAHLVAAKRKGLWLPSLKNLAAGSFAEVSGLEADVVVRVEELSTEGVFELGATIAELVGAETVEATEDDPRSPPPSRSSSASEASSRRKRSPRTRSARRRRRRSTPSTQARRTLTAERSSSRVASSRATRSLRTLSTPRSVCTSTARRTRERRRARRRRRRRTSSEAKPVACGSSSPSRAWRSRRARRRTRRRGASSPRRTSLGSKRPSSSSRRSSTTRGPVEPVTRTRRRARRTGY